MLRNLPPHQRISDEIGTAEQPYGVRREKNVRDQGSHNTASRRAAKMLNRADVDGSEHFPTISPVILTQH